MRRRAIPHSGQATKRAMVRSNSGVNTVVAKRPFKPYMGEAPEREEKYEEGRGEDSWAKPGGRPVGNSGGGADHTLTHSRQRMHFASSGRYGQPSSACTRHPRNNPLLQARSFFRPPTELRRAQKGGAGGECRPTNIAGHRKSAEGA